MTDVPLVSVVIPVFNGLPFLRDALASVELQTYKSLEIVIVDGGSDEETVDFVKSVEHQVVKAEFLPRGTPVEETWTRCSQLATGEFVKLLCQDDVLDPEALEQQVEFLSANPQAGMVFSKRNVIDAAGEILVRGRGGVRGSSRVLPGRKALLSGYLAGANVFGEPVAVMFRRDALQQELPWDASVPYLIDMSMYARVMMRGPVGYLDEVVGGFRVSSQSWSTRLSAQQTRQFRQWQARVAHDLGNVTGRQRLVAWLNAWKVSWMRAAAYRWLRLRSRLH